jgi:hypothetical protein
VRGYNNNGLIVKFNYFENKKSQPPENRLSSNKIAEVFKIKDKTAPEEKKKEPKKAFQRVPRSHRYLVDPARLDKKRTNGPRKDDSEDSEFELPCSKPTPKKIKVEKDYSGFR